MITWFRNSVARSKVLWVNLMLYSQKLTTVWLLLNTLWIGLMEASLILKLNSIFKLKASLFVDSTLTWIVSGHILSRTLFRRIKTVKSSEIKFTNASKNLTNIKMDQLDKNKLLKLFLNLITSPLKTLNLKMKLRELWITLLKKIRNNWMMVRNLKTNY